MAYSGEDYAGICMRSLKINYKTTRDWYLLPIMDDFIKIKFILMDD